MTVTQKELAFALRKERVAYWDTASGDTSRDREEHVFVL